MIGCSQECLWGLWEKPCCCAKWFLALLHSLLQAYMQPDQTRRSPPVSPQQLQGIDFFLSFLFLPLSCRRILSLCFIFSTAHLLQGGPPAIHWFNRQKIDPISSKLAFSELISWHLGRPGSWMNAGFSAPPLFSYLAIGSPGDVHRVGWLFSSDFVVVKWSHEVAMVADRRSVLSHLSAGDSWYDSSSFPKDQSTILTVFSHLERADGAEMPELVVVIAQRAVLSSCTPTVRRWINYTVSHCKCPSSLIWVDLLWGQLPWTAPLRPPGFVLSSHFDQPVSFSFLVRALKTTMLFEDGCQLWSSANCPSFSLPQLLIWPFVKPATCAAFFFFFLSTFSEQVLLSKLFDQLHPIIMNPGGLTTT